MAKKQVRWYVRRVAKFGLDTFIADHPQLCAKQQVAITHEGLKALEQAKKGEK